MNYLMKTCVICGEEFELKPDKPGYANRCPDCSEPEAAEERNRQGGPDFERQGEANEERRRAIRDLLYRKDS